MGIILCNSKRAERPYYIESIGKRIFSAEQLCYFIYEYPLIAIDGFVNDRLISFIRNELKLNPRMGSVTTDEFLISILELTDYYNSNDIDVFRNKLTHIRSLKKHEFLKAKADFMFRLSHYGAAIRFYEDSAEEAVVSGNDLKFLSEVWHNKGSCYANLFEYEKAFDAYKNAYEYNKDKLILKHIYFLSFIDPIIENRQRYQEMLGGKTDPHWDREYESVVEQASSSVAVEEFREELNKDSVKRLKAINEQILSQKLQFREMI